LNEYVAVAATYQPLHGQGIDALLKFGGIGLWVGRRGGPLWKKQAARLGSSRDKVPESDT